MGKALVVKDVNFSANKLTTVVLSSSIPEYVLVAGYSPDRRGSGNHAATIENKGTSSQYHVLAADNSNTSVLPIEDKDGQDTGEFRFVPIVLPQGVTGFTITSEFGMKTRILWFDNTMVSDVNARGAWVVAGNVSSVSAWDQADWSTTITITKPSDSGINSFGGLVYTKDHPGVDHADEADIITITYTYS